MKPFEDNERVITIPAHVFGRNGRSAKVVVVDDCRVSKMMWENDPYERWHHICYAANNRVRAAIIRYLFELYEVSDGEVNAAIADGWL